MIRGAFKRFNDFLTEKRPHLDKNTLKLSQIDKLMIIDFVSYLESKSRGEGASSYFERFKKIIKRAVDEEIIYKNPTMGVRCKTVSGLGHTSIRETEKYTRVIDELKKRAVNSLPDYLLSVNSYH